MSYLRNGRYYSTGWFGILFIAGLLVGSCGKKPQEDKTPSDTVITDTIAADTIVEEEDSVPTYFSDDLKSFGIRGDVAERSEMRHSSPIVYPLPLMALKFDEKGNFIGNLEGLYPKENEDGIIYSYSMNYEDGTSWELTYTELNANSFPVKAEILESGPQGVAKVELTYYGYEYDAAGNWVMRSVGMNREFTETETNEKTNSSAKWKELVSYKYNERKEISAEETQDK